MNSKLFDLLKPLEPKHLKQALEDYCEEKNLTHEFVEGFENHPNQIRLDKKTKKSRSSR